MSGFKKLELDFLWEISKILSKNCEENVFAQDLKSIFEKYLNVNSARIFVVDEQTGALKDFEKSWISLDKNSPEDELLKKLNTQNAEKNFILNGKNLSYEISLEILENEFSTVLKEEDNILVFPILNEQKVKGLLKLNFDRIIDEVKKSDFIASMGIAAAQISGAVINRMLNNQMVINLNFQNVMKNIAKLIETQYDLTYILPIIGEMADRFVNEHLIYIFMKDKEEALKLVWPLQCNDERINVLIENFDESKNYTVSPDSKAGVWALKNEEETIGYIAAGSSTEKLSPKDIEYITHLARQASVTIGHANSYAKILQYATLDALTGLNNRRQFETRLNQETATSRRKHKPLCCIMLDIDHFKSVNDTYGHAAGDSVLKNVARVICSQLREYDIASRYGGEEFCILLPDTVLTEAEFVAERLRSAVEKAQIDIEDFGVLNVTISVGVSSFDDKMKEANNLYENADAALYEAKKSGRNRVVVFKD